MLRCPAFPLAALRTTVHAWRRRALLVMLIGVPMLSVAAPLPPSSRSQPPADSAPPARAVVAPPALEAWSGWVAQSRDDRGCPDVAGKACVWLGPLDITVDGDTVRFVFSARNLATGPRYMQLPGRLSAWPQDVRANGRPVAIEARGESAGWSLPAGFNGRMEGTLLRHGLDPLPLDAGFPWATVTVAGHPDQQRLVAITPDGLVLDRLPPTPAGASAVAASDQPVIKVQRYLSDGQIPEMMVRVRVINPGGRVPVSVSGLLPAGAQVFGLVSPVPASWDHDRLQIGAMPGEQAVSLNVRLPHTLTPLTSHPLVNGGTLDDQEYWFVRSDARLRRLTITSPAVDPRTVPHDAAWDNVPTYATTSGAPLALTTQMTQDDVPRITATATSDLWLDLDGQGATLRQTLAGTAPLPGVFSVDPRWDLQEAQLGQVPVLIGQTIAGAAKTVAHRPGPFEAHLSARGPATWVLNVPNVLPVDVEASESTVSVHLPPGALVLGASGQGVTSVGWWASFNLWDWFWIIVLGWALNALLGWRIAVLGLLTVTLGHLYDASLGPVWLLPLLGLAWLMQVLPSARHGLRAASTIWGSLVTLMLVMVSVPRVMEVLHPVMTIDHHVDGPENVFIMLGSFADLVAGMMFFVGLALIVYTIVLLSKTRKGKPFPLRGWMLGPLGLLMVALPAYLSMGSSTVNADGAAQKGMPTGAYVRTDNDGPGVPQAPAIPAPMVEHRDQMNALASIAPQKAPPPNFQGQGGAQVQTGEPQWRGETTRLSVSGPVTAGQPLTLWWLPSPWARMGNLVQLLMLWTLVGWLARAVQRAWTQPSASYGPSPEPDESVKPAEGDRS